MPLLNLTPRWSLTMILAVAAVTTAVFLPGSSAYAQGEVGVSSYEDGVSTDYDVGGGDCEDGHEYSRAQIGSPTGAIPGGSDPVGALFRGVWAGPTNVSEYISGLAGWTHTENFGAQALYVRESGGLSGNYRCIKDDFANASAQELPSETKWVAPSRYHVRLWNIPDAEGPNGSHEVETVGTPHHEKFVKTLEDSNCHTLKFEYLGVEVTVGGNHAIFPGGENQPAGDSGFDEGREALRRAFESHEFKVRPEPWGNTEEFHQCNGWMAGSNGTGTIITVDRRMQLESRSATFIGSSGAHLNAFVKTGEPRTKLWFGVASHPSQGVSSYTKVSLPEIAGPAEQSVSFNLEGLAPDSTHYVRLFAENESHEVEESEETHFTTCGASLEESLGASNPRAIASCRGTIDDFFREPSGELGHDWYDTGGLGWQSGNLPGPVASAPDAVAQEDGTMDVFFRTPSGELGHDWYGTGPAGWASANLPGPVASAPDAVVQGDGTIDVFFRTPSGELGHDWYSKGGTWASGNLPGPVASPPRAVVQPNGTIDVFFRTPSGELGHDWYSKGGTWASGNLPGPVAADAEPHPVVQSNGTVDVFFRTPSGEVGHDWYGSTGEGWGSGNLPGPLPADAEPHPVVQPDGTIDVFFRTPSGELGHDWYDTGTLGWLSGNLPGPVQSEPSAAAQPDGTVDVFFKTSNGELGHDWYDTGTLGWLSGSLAGPVASSPQATVQYNGTADVFFRTPEGQMGHDWYDTGGLGWQSGNLPGPIAPDQPRIVPGSVTAISTTGATLNGSVNPEGATTTYQFEFGATASYGSKAPASAQGIGSGNLDVAVSQALTGLSPGTTYHYRLVATSAEGTTYGPDGTFKTSPPNPPTATSGEATSIGSSGATLGASINPNGGGTEYRFEYGTTTAYGKTTEMTSAGAGSSAVAVSKAVTGLEPASNYHFRVVATNAGGTTYGLDRTFTTKAPSLTVDKTVTTHETSAAKTISSPALTTSAPNELLVAFIASDGPSTGSGETISGVTGGGLTWHLVRRANAQAGTAEIWAASATAVVTNATATATRSSGSYVGSITVVAMSGADLVAEGASAAAGAASGAPSVSLATTRANSWVWGVGDDWDSATARTVGTGQTKVDEFLPSTGDTMWVQRQTAVTPASGTSVTLNDTAPTGDRWNLASVEIRPASTDTQAPTAPTGLTAGTATTSKVPLSWAASSDDHGVVGYRIFRNGTQIGEATGTTFTDSTVAPVTTYAYTVKAFDAAGNVSGASNQLNVTTPEVATATTLATTRVLNGQPGYVSLSGSVNASSGVPAGKKVKIWFEAETSPGGWTPLNLVERELDASGAFVDENQAVGQANWRARAEFPAAGTFATSSSANVPFHVGLGYQLVFQHSYKCADVQNGGTGDGALLQQWDCLETATHLNQVFQLVPVSGPWYEIRDIGSGKCVDISGGSTANGAWLQQWDCLGDGQQLFQEVQLGGGWVSLQAYSDGKCIDVNSSSTEDGVILQQWDCQWGPNQAIAFVPTG
jgi:hypothetical protein